jgi:hypothetical protein
MLFFCLNIHPYAREIKPGTEENADMRTGKRIACQRKKDFPGGDKTLPPPEKGWVR